MESVYGRIATTNPTWEDLATGVLFLSYEQEQIPRFARGDTPKGISR